MLVRLVLSRLQSLDRAADDVGWEFNKMNFGFGRPSDERLALREVKRDLLEPWNRCTWPAMRRPK